MGIARNLQGTGVAALAAEAIVGTVADGLAATGTTQADSFLISTDRAIFSTVPVGAGARLPVGGENDKYVVMNDTANDLKLYPPLGGTIGGGAVNVALTLTAGQTYSLFYQDYLTIRQDSVPYNPNNVFVTQATLAATTGATVVGSEDGASGTLWTTIAGFITRIRSSAGASVVGFIQAGIGAVIRTVQAKMRERFSVKDFGAVGDGVANDKPAFAAAINAAIAAGGGAIYIPTGRYYIPNTGGNLTVGSNVTIYGDGMKNSVIVFDDSASATRSDLFYKVTGNIENVEFRDFGIESNCMTDFVQRSHLIELANVTGLKVRGMRFFGSRYMSLIASKCSDVSVTGCHFEKGIADGCRVVSSTNVVIADNTFKDICDDAVACHSNDADTIVRSTITITGNVLTDCQGIVVLGAKRTTISNNVLTRPHTRAIYVDANGSFGEGATASHSIVITGNVITDVFNGASFSTATGAGNFYIHMSSAPATNGGAGAFVGGNDTTAGTVLSPLGFLELNNVDAAGKSAGTWFINISNNICTRTLPLVAAYSDYGHGQRFSRTGYSNIAITAPVFDSGTANGISLTGQLRHAAINGNTISGMRNAIALLGDSTAETNGLVAFSDINISGNTLSDFLQVGVLFERKTSAVLISGNVLDGDPYHSSANRLANGKWVAVTGGIQYPTGVFANSSDGQVVSGNAFRNVYFMTFGAGQSAYLMLGNVGYCDPVALNYDANNIGIANVDINHTYVIEEGDPTLVGYGKLKNMPITSASAVPTAGKYVRPHFVRNSNPVTLGAAGSQYIILGWSRKTVGTAHVLNTDWSEARCLTGT